jgi:CRP-like cAMP-binding protein
MVAIERLRQVQVFSDLADEDLQQIAALGQERKMADGDWCFEAGAPATDRFWDSEGYLTIEMIEPNHIFGWSALVPPHEMTLSARCVGPCTVLQLPGDGLLALFECDPEMGYRVMTNLARVIGSRLRVTRQKLILELGTSVHLGR